MSTCSAVPCLCGAGFQPVVEVAGRKPAPVDVTQTRQIRAVPVSECATPDHGMEVGPETHTSRWWLLGLMGVHAALLCYAAVRLSPTWDDPRRLSAGVQRWAFGDFALDIGNPPLVSLVAGFPVKLAGARIGDTGHRFAEINGPRVLTLVTIGRLACIPFGLMGVWICWRWGTELYGARSGFFAALLWCFCPLVLAHGPLVTADVASASLGACAFFALRQWLCNSTWPRAVIAGLLLGVALLTKYVWVIMPGLWVRLWLFWRSRERGVMPKHFWLRDIRQIGGMAVVALYVVNAAFGFKGSFHPLAEHPLWGQTKTDQPNSDGESAVVRWLGRSPVPLPRDFLGGIGAVADSRAREHTHYFNGSTRQQGSPWFYIVGLTLKLPLGGHRIDRLGNCGALFSGRRFELAGGSDPGSARCCPADICHLGHIAAVRPLYPAGSAVRPDLDEPSVSEFFRTKPSRTDGGGLRTPGMVHSEQHASLSAQPFVHE